MIVVFGASSGIGRQTALDFARRGAKIVVAARSEAGLYSLVEEIYKIKRICGDNCEAFAMKAEAADFEQVKKVADAAVEQFGRLDTWVHSADIKIRRAIIGLSLVGIGATAAVSLFQTEIVKHLPDLPLPDFDSDKVNSSETPYALGVPDGILALAGIAANLPLAAFGGENRAETMPLVPIVAAAKASVEAIVSGWYFYQMPAVERKWCTYCIVGAAASFSIAALTLAEAKHAWDNLR